MDPLQDAYSWSRILLKILQLIEILEKRDEDAKHKMDAYVATLENINKEMV